MMWYDRYFCEQPTRCHTANKAYKLIQISSFSNNKIKVSSRSQAHPCHLFLKRKFLIGSYSFHDRINGFSRLALITVPIVTKDAIFWMKTQKNGEELGTKVWLMTTWPWHLFHLIAKETLLTSSSFFFSIAFYTDQTTQTLKYCILSII